MRWHVKNHVQFWASSVKERVAELLEGVQRKATKLVKGLENNTLRSDWVKWGCFVWNRNDQCLKAIKIKYIHHLISYCWEDGKYSTHFCYQKLWKQKLKGWIVFCLWINQKKRGKMVDVSPIQLFLKALSCVESISVCNLFLFVWISCKSLQYYFHNG